MTQTRRNWKDMSDEQLIQYGREHGLFGMSPTDARGKDSGYHTAVRERGLLSVVFERKTIDWESMSDSQLLEYGKKHSLFGLSPAKAKEKNDKYYRAVVDRELGDKVFERAIRSRRKWSEMSDEEFIQYGKDHGLFGLNTGDIMKKDPRYYFEAKDRKLDQVVFKKIHTNWSEMSDEELLQYGRENGLIGLSPKDTQKKSGFYKAVRERGLHRRVFSYKTEKLEQALKELIGDAA